MPIARTSDKPTVVLVRGAFAEWFVTVTEPAAVAALIGEAAGTAASRRDHRVDAERMSVEA